MKIGIIKERRGRWEARAPLIPEHVKLLKEDYGIHTIVQSSPNRIFKDEEYRNAGAEVAPDLKNAQIIFGVKEISCPDLEPGKTYIFFSHTIKGQRYNMPMLQKILDLKCNLLDYERIVDDKGRRLIFFGRYAGLAGMIDSLWTLGRRISREGISDYFSKIKRAYEYDSLDDVKQAFRAVGDEIHEKGLPEDLTPLICGITGYGHVSKGAQEILECFPIIEIEPERLPELGVQIPISKNHLYKVVFKEKHFVKPKDPATEFSLQDYYDHPEKYIPRFSDYLPYLTMIINCIYWEPRYPRLITRKVLQELFRIQSPARLRVIGDISCDIEGSVEVTVKTTSPESPAYTYYPGDDSFKDKITDYGVAIVARDNLPCELPRDSSYEFSSQLVKFVPQIVQAHINNKLDKNALPEPLQRALIVHNGELTEDYKYLMKFLTD
jgi:alpha-aminoadipic semialdehyde synthase